MSEFRELSDKEYDTVSTWELGYWKHTSHPATGPWWYYDRHFIQYIERYGTVIDIGCGPVPYFMNHNVIAGTKIAVDPLIDKYLEMAKYAADPFVVYLKDIAEVKSGIADAVFALNVLDHAREPEWLMSEIMRVLKSGGRLFLYVDLDKEPSPGHPHKISYKWLLSKLTRFRSVYCELGSSWKFANRVFWYVGDRRE